MQPCSTSLSRDRSTAVSEALATKNDCSCENHEPSNGNDTVSVRTGPTRSAADNRRPVSSNASRTAASSGVSPGSRPPPTVNQ
jgi:hypothetical protein